MAFIHEMVCNKIFFVLHLKLVLKQYFLKTQDVLLIQIKINL